MTTSDFRRLSDYEAQLLGVLLSHEFPGRDELRLQVEDCLVKTIDEDGSLEFRIVTPKANASVKKRVPVEGEWDDTDGIVGHVLLHVLNGVLSELELYKEDGTVVNCPPAPASLRVFASS